LKIFPQTEGSLIESQQLIIPKENKNSSLSPMTFPQQKIESAPINSNHEVLDLIQQLIQNSQKGEALMLLDSLKEQLQKNEKT